MVFLNQIYNATPTGDEINRDICVSKPTEHLGIQLSLLVANVAYDIVLTVKHTLLLTLAS